MRRSHSRSALLLIATAASLATSAQSIAQQEGQTLPPGQVAAVLKSRDVTFIYRTTTTPLACDQLRNRVANVLRAVGARDDLRVVANDCEGFIPPDPRQRAGQSGSNISGTFEPYSGGDLSNPMTS